MKKLISPKQVARAIGVSESTLKRWCDRGLIPMTKTAGGHRRMEVEAVVDAAKLAKEGGAERFCMGAAWRNPTDKNLDKVIEMIEAVGHESATRLAADLLRPGGRIGALGVHTEPHLALSPGELYDRNLSYAAGRCPARHYMPASLDLALREQDRIATMISHRLPLSEGVEAYRRFAAREPGWNKVVLLP